MTLSRSTHAGPPVSLRGRARLGRDRRPPPPILFGKPFRSPIFFGRARFRGFITSAPFISFRKLQSDPHIVPGRRVAVRDVDLFVTENGTGTPVLLLHGNPDSADIWDDLVSRLRDSYRCIAPDLPGFGRSSVTRNFDFSFESLGRFVEEAVEAIGVTDPVHLVAHDFGGAFGMAWAIIHPERVRTITVINHPFFLGDYRWHTWARIWRTPVVGEMSMMLMNWPLFRQSIRKGSRMLSDDKIRAAYSFMDRKSKRAILRLYRAATPKSFREWEPRMLQITATIPTFVLWGEHDPYIPAWVADRFAADEVVSYPESGHWTPAEVPDRVAADLRRWFAEHAVMPTDD